MTYFGFLLRFLIAPILVLLAILYWDIKKKRQLPGSYSARRVWTAIGIHVLLAVAYTTPWDNYLVATGVWYYNPKLVTGMLIGYVPIEEYTFFILETVLAGLWWRLLARHLFPIPSFPSLGLTQNRILIYSSTSLLFILWLASGYLFFFGTAEWTYLSIILFWALPPLSIQLLYGADILWRYRRLVFQAVLVPALYLSLMDVLALNETTWSISPAQTTGILFFGILPVEEVLFFLVTNMLIIFGMTLLLAPVSQERFAGIRRQLQAWRERRAPRPR